MVCRERTTPPSRRQLPDDLAKVLDTWPYRHPILPRKTKLTETERTFETERPLGVHILQVCSPP
jgi:hypothetical protein